MKRYERRNGLREEAEEVKEKEKRGDVRVWASGKPVILGASGVGGRGRRKIVRVWSLSFFDLIYSVYFSFCSCSLILSY